MTDWRWEEIDYKRAGVAGDLAKLFRHEAVKRPGAFAVDAPSIDATLLAREVIQNSWDAARAHRKELAEEGIGPPEFDIEFKFDRLEPGHRRELVDLLDLEAHAQRIDQIEAEQDEAEQSKVRSHLGLGERDILQDLMGEQPLRTLTITERGTTGMFGPWTGPDSKMWLALVSVGITEKAVGAGGSYGYGKAGLIRGSRIRMVLAYTRFRERADEPGVTRRLLGMTYWGLHKIEGTSYSGFAYFGDDQGDHVRPWTDDQADEIARSLGIETRAVDDPGTTFVLLDPGVEAVDLCQAIERNWWPVLQTAQEDFEATIITEEGEELVPQPKSDPLLQPFIRGLELATVQQDNTVDDERSHRFNPHKVDDATYELGAVGLVSDEEGWSYPPADDISHRSLVALVRGPKMVVEYHECGQAAPYVRGTFVADDSIDDLLRNTEPMAHDAWDDSEDGLGGELAKVVHRRIRSQVDAFRKDLRPPTPDKRELRLPEFEKLFKGIFDSDGTTPPPPPSGDRNLSISILDQSPTVAPDDPNMIRLEAQVGVRLSDKVQAPTARVAVRIRYQFLEDGTARTECGLKVNRPPGFTDRSDSFPGGSKDSWHHGELTHDQVVFSIQSDSYTPDWTGRIVIEGDLEDVLEKAANDGD